MSDWRPASGVDAAARRAALLGRIRSYFAAQGVLPVDTPVLSAATATDPQVASIPAGAGAWLRTSPEFFMKRLLAAGYPDIYSICPVFRAGEAGFRHLPEFTMVEWYRHGHGLTDIVADTLALIAAALPAPARRTAETTDYRDAFLRHAGVDPIADDIDTLAAAAGADPELRHALGDDRDLWLDLLLATVVAPRFRRNVLTVLRHYPASQAALARLCPADPRFADRFEVYAGDLELANGYVELTDAAEQARRMQADAEVRQRRGLPAVRRDERLLAALAAGLPDCAGVALGLERLQMLADRTDDIKNVVAFSGDVP
jgi:lysyl-tRNA synthetase class 2